MQQSPLLQSRPFGDGNPSQKSKAESEASQRDHLRPSACKVGDIFYRYENHLVSAGVDEFDESLGAYIELYCMAFNVVSVTVKDVKIEWYTADGVYAPRPVMDHYINKFAYPNKVEALLGFLSRKRRQQAILHGQIGRSKEAAVVVNRHLEREMKKCPK